MVHDIHIIQVISRSLGSALKNSVDNSNPPIWITFFWIKLIIPEISYLIALKEILFFLEKNLNFLKFKAEVNFLAL